MENNMKDTTVENSGSFNNDIPIPINSKNKTDSLNKSSDTKVCGVPLQNDASHFERRNALLVCEVSKQTLKHSQIHVIANFNYGTKGYAVCFEVIKFLIIL